VDRLIARMRDNESMPRSCQVVIQWHGKRKMPVLTATLCGMNCTGVGVELLLKDLTRMIGGRPHNRRENGVGGGERRWRRSTHLGAKKVDASAVWLVSQRTATEAVLRRRDQATRERGGDGRSDQGLRSTVERSVDDIKVSYVNDALIAA
jgi:hypothetical protein